VDRLALGLVALSLLSGCPGLFEEQVDGLRQLSGARTSDWEGFASFKVDVQEDDEALLVTAAAEEGYQVYLHSLAAPGGTVVLDALEIWDDQQYSVTGGAYPYPSTSVNWPIGDGDLALSPGKWEVVLGVVDSDLYYVRNAEVEVDVLLKADDSLAGGVVHASLILAGAAAQDTELVRATEVAIERWQLLYALQGISVEVTWYEYDNGDLPGPGLGAAGDFIAIAEGTPLRSVNVVVVPEMRNGEGIYGMAGGIPGPLVATERSAVVVSALTNSGPDLVFDEEEERLYGETIAHEVGHYLGLFHPVEVTYDTWDSLSDTPLCDDRLECETVLGENLMFPYPVCSQWSCRPQDELTAQQGSVGNHYVGVE